MIWQYNSADPWSALYSYISLIRTSYRYVYSPDRDAVADLLAQYLAGLGLTDAQLQSQTAAVSIAGMPLRVRWVAVDFGSQILVAITGNQSAADWGQVLAGYSINPSAIPFNLWAVNPAVLQWRESMFAALTGWLTTATPAVPIVVAGHSFGGALAGLVARQLRDAEPTRLVTCVTYGSPKFAGPLFWAPGNSVNYFHLQNIEDPIPIFPPSGIWLAAAVAVRFPGVHYNPGLFSYSANAGTTYRMDNSGVITKGSDGTVAAISSNAPNFDMLLHTAFSGQSAAHDAHEYQRRLRRRFGFLPDAPTVDRVTNSQNRLDGLNWSIPIPAEPPPPIAAIDAPPLPLLQRLQLQRAIPGTAVPVDGEQPHGPYLATPFAPIVAPPRIVPPNVPTGPMPNPPNLDQAASARSCCVVTTPNGVIQVVG